MRASPVVLVVDDDAAWREVVVETLRLAGFAPVEAANGAEALRLLRRGEVSPAVVVLDLSMPVLDGWGFRRRLLRDPALARLPVVVVSGDDPGALPAVRRLAKPCAPAELLAEVSRAAMPARRAA